MAVLKSTLAVTLAAARLAAATSHCWRTRARPAALLALGTACFLVVALAHVGEAFGLLPAFGWGQPHSVGHYLDLAAALGGGALASAGLLQEYLARHRPPPGAPSQR